MFGLTTFIVLSAAALRASAIPFTKLIRELPTDISHIGLDEPAAEFIAYKQDGTMFGRYPATAEHGLSKRESSCSNLSVDDLQKLPGWDQINKYADDNFGTGSRKIVMNPDDYPDNPAQVCVTTDIVQLVTGGDATCQTNTVTTDGELVGTDGQVAIAVTTGFSTTNTWTVSQESSIGVDTTLGVTVGIPEIADVSASVTISTSVTNSLSSSISATYTDQNTVTVTMNAPEGQKCHANVETKTCNTPVHGSIRYLATGWAWFNYDSSTNGHYKWAASIDTILSNQDDRSSFVDFGGSLQSQTKTGYKGSCSA